MAGGGYDIGASFSGSSSSSASNASAFDVSGGSTQSNTVIYIGLALAAVLVVWIVMRK